LVLLAAAGLLIWDGIDSTDRAKAELDTQKAKGAARNFETLQHGYPYSNAAIDARQMILESQVSAREQAAASRKTVGKEELKTLAMEIPDRTKKGISLERPYIQPDAAAIIGVAGLLLALILPGTRFRGLAFLGLLIGGAAALAGMLPVDNQVALVQWVSPLKYVITNFPRVAQACLALAGLTLAARVSPSRRASA
jgi:hypothetical protein